MNTQEVANQLVALCRQNKNVEAINTLYAENIVSIESAGAPVERTEGIDAVRDKTNNFYAMIEEFHGGEISDPLVGENHFSVNMTMDTTMKGFGRSTMNEICVYEVKDGKIVKEQFFYNRS